MKRSNKAGGNHVPRDAQSAFANAIVGCLTMARDFSLDAACFPAMQGDQRLLFVETFMSLYDRMEEAVWDATGRHYKLPEVEQPLIKSLPGKGA